MILKRVYMLRKVNVNKEKEKEKQEWLAMD
jgi:hypothetical protein